MSCCEAISMRAFQSPPKSYDEHDPPIIDAELFQRQYRGEVTSPLTKFTNHISKYSMRSLTRKDDVLNAISGLLSRAPFCSFYGIPVASTSLSKSDTGFAIGLWWGFQSCRFRGRRRKHFPSWSWTGWENPMAYPRANSYSLYELYVSTPRRRSMTVDEAKCDARFMLEDHNKNTVTLQAAIEALNGSKMIPPTKYALTIEARVFHRRPPPFGSLPNLCTCPSQTEHTERMRMKNSQVDSYTSSRYSSNVTKTRECEQWDYVLLFESPDGELCLLTIKWKDNVAYRVGFIQAGPYQVPKFCSRPNIKRRIRMG
jgi:hypothetical protein